ncbi:MAG: UDP-N-acetylmuramate dehydrogenase [Spirulina sp. SIO3F2]|nr:UDP-N-acetylmuramate dehydrogenase [Spirulina sp. SIO3F2]
MILSCETARPNFAVLGHTPTAIPLPGSDCCLQPNFSLAELTSFRVGGTADWFVTPRTHHDLQESLAWAQRHDLPITILGAGSNLLISDRGVPGLVLSTRYLKQTSFDSETGQFTASAGEPIPKLAWRVAKRGWKGFEWAVGIPGTVGGAVVMNAGAHQASLSDCLVQVRVMDTAGHILTLTPEMLRYSYRHSSLQGSNFIVLDATFALSPGHERAEVVAETNRNLQKRKQSQPYHLPSCGSVFRNPESHAAGWLIEQLGLKGYQIGGAQVAHRHANFILNCDNATAQDIFNVIRYVQAQVEEHWSLTLQPEVKFLGEF